MNIFIIDDHVLFREGIVSLLKGRPEVNLAGHSGFSTTAVENVWKVKPDTLLMDIEPNPDEGIEAIRTIQTKSPLTKIVLLGMDESDEILFSAIRNGISGYLLKTISLTKLVASLHALERGEVVFHRAMIGRILEEFNRLSAIKAEPETYLNLLTSRERDVLIELAKEASNREIANRLTIAENTVKVHVHNILDKLNLRNRREVVHYARRFNLNRT
jgi:two-component system, NarL family, nitrate/nitrite response regulator NarL